jgi:hypothetical protein
MVEVAIAHLLQVAPSALSVVLLWRVRTLELELLRVNDSLLRHLEYHSQDYLGDCDCK